MTRIVIAGGGPAAVEGLLELRRLVPAAEIELVAPCDEFVNRPLAVGEPFGRGFADRFSLARIAALGGASLIRNSVTRVECGLREVTLASGERRSYDALLFAVGARATEALPGAITFWGSDGDPAFRKALALVERGEGGLTFAVPPGVAWTLPLYELALLTSDHLRNGGFDARLTLVTSEPVPLAIFGGAASAEVARQLRDSGIELIAGSDPLDHCLDGAGGEIVVTLPRPIGRGIPDLPVDRERFVPVDEYCRVLGAPGVYAAGDVTDSPIKQGGLGAQQADAAASAIAADLGEAIEPVPAARVLRGRVFSADEPTFMRWDPDVDRPPASSDQPLWWPGSKTFGRQLAPFLAALASEDQRSTRPLSSA